MINGVNGSASLRGYDLTQRGRKAEGAASFGERLARTQSAAAQQSSPSHIYVRLPGENWLASGGNLAEDHFYVEYTGDSTDEDPTVRITGRSERGEEFDYIKRIYDIDPRSASYVELEALYKHQRKTGAFQTNWLTRDEMRALPVGGMENIDYWERQNFLDKLQELTVSKRFSSSHALTAEEMLKLYEGYVSQRFPPQEGVTVDSSQYADGLLALSRMAAPHVEPAPVSEPAQETEDAASKTYYVEGGPTLIEQFGEKFLDVLATPNTCTLLKMKEDSVCSTVYGIGGTQYVYAEYTVDSTPEDPIVRIFCQSRGGLYEFTRHINDIDPSNCTFAELAALHGHLQKNGVDIPGNDDSWPVPSGYEIGDLMGRQNFVAGLDGLSQSNMFDPGMLADAEALFQFYSLLAEEKKALEAEEAEFEALMAAVDNMIENKGAMEPREILERLSEPAKDTLEDLKADKEV